MKSSRDGYIFKYTDLRITILNPKTCRVIADTYVTDDSGTGVVHQAPAFGEDDNRVCLTNGILKKGEELPCPVDLDGRWVVSIRRQALLIISLSAPWTFP